MIDAVGTGRRGGSGGARDAEEIVGDGTTGEVAIEGEGDPGEVFEERPGVDALRDERRAAESGEAGDVVDGGEGVELG